MALPHVSPYDSWGLPQIEDYYRQYPGAAPNGTGDTGLLPNDEQGYTDLENLHTRYLQLKGANPSIRGLRDAASEHDGSFVPDNAGRLAYENATPDEPGPVGSMNNPSLLMLRNLKMSR